MAGKNRAKNSVFIDKTGETLTGHVQLTNEINAVKDALTSHLAEYATFIESITIEEDQPWEEDE